MRAREDDGRETPDAREGRMQTAADARLILVTGGAASGKSEYAEDLAVRLREEAWEEACGKIMDSNHGRVSNLEARLREEACGRPGSRPVLWYAATMHRDPGDPEIEKRIGRHRQLRAGKGFCTLEQETGIGECGKRMSDGDIMLLEDLPNLLANEMFLRQRVSEDEIKESILVPLLRLRERGIHMIVVSGRVTEELPQDGDVWTAGYLDRLRLLTRELGKAADQVTEVVCGIPVCARAHNPTCP